MGDFPLILYDPESVALLCEDKLLDFSKATELALLPGYIKHLRGAGLE